LFAKVNGKDVLWSIYTLGFTTTNFFRQWMGRWRVM